MAKLFAMKDLALKLLIHYIGRAIGCVRESVCVGVCQRESKRKSSSQGAKKRTSEMDRKCKRVMCVELGFGMQRTCNETHVIESNGTNKCCS